ncbi:hypothetical protein [Chlorogloeopsis sp. ULAP01]|nr:hypothetical protein [Chlorogloeopsis sp. ULAP01]
MKKAEGRGGSALRSHCGGEPARWAATRRVAASRLVPTCSDWRKGFPA